MFENLEFLEKIKAEKTLKEIASLENSSLDEVYRKIIDFKNMGLVFDKVLYDNGDIRYIHLKKPTDERCSIKIKLMDKYKFSAMVISDLHLGNMLECMDYLDMVYDFCQKFGIHIIINGGDLIDGGFSKGEQKINDPIKQLDYVIKNYPTSDNILNLICLGNHDYSLYKYGIDMKKVLENARYDLIPLGYGLGILNVENNQLFVRHNISDLDFETINNKFILEGHRHKMAFTSEGNGFLVNIPTLSNLVLGKHEFPGAIRMDLFFNNDGYIDRGHFEQFLFSDEMHTVNEASFKFNLDYGLLNEEDVRPKVRYRSYNGQSQIDKFYKKWKM